MPREPTPPAAMTEDYELKARINAADALIKNLRAEGQTSRADYVAELQSIAAGLLAERAKLRQQISEQNRSNGTES